MFDKRQEVGGGKSELQICVLLMMLLFFDGNIILGVNYGMSTLLTAEFSAYRQHFIKYYRASYCC